MKRLNRVTPRLGLAAILVIIACGSQAAPTTMPTQPPTPAPIASPTVAPTPAPEPTAPPIPSPTAAQPAPTPVPSEPVNAVSLSPSKDNTLYEDAAGSLSNGLGQHFFVGNTGGGSARRGVIAFDIAANVPPGATINNVSLTLHMSRSMEDTPQDIVAHKLLADWGEGTSDAPGNEGSGADATPNDATWLHRFFDTETWTEPGGDFAPSASASIAVAGIRPYTWGSTPEMLADVQGWLDDPATNFGWLLSGNEDEPGTAKRFDSKENEVLESHPMLTIEFTPPGSP